MKWISVYFNCTDGWDGVITSIPESEKENAVAYLENNAGLHGVHNLTFDQQTFFDSQRLKRHDNN